MNRISKYFGEKLIIDNIEFKLSNGVTLILGENGSGKTTLFKILAGFIKSFDGKVECDDNVSLLLDAPSLSPFKSGMDNICMYLDYDEQKNAQKYINIFNMKSYINKLVKSYSNGMKKKLSLVIALAKNKKYLLLDEPTNSLDIDSVNLLKKILFELKKEKYILISSHDISIFDIDLIDSIFKLKNGGLYSLKVSDLDYKYYRIKTLNKIDNCKYNYEYVNGHYYFKIYNNELSDFSYEISKFLIIEMQPINYLDDIYMRGLYND